MRFFPAFLMFFLFMLAFSCKHVPKENETYIPLFSTYQTDSAALKTPAEKKEIFYGILTPVEICAIFSRLNVPYNDTTLNPPSNKDFYLSSSKASINTGIYGSDFAYLKIFGIGQELINNMIAIRDLSDKLGIPDKLISDPLKKVRSDMSEPDTIMALIDKAFRDIEDHLRADGRESTAGLIVMGGWVEAMFIATQLVYDPAKPDPEVVEKIAEQKYTLNSLLSFMKNYYDDPVVVYYTKKLRFLKNYFDTFDIYFRKGDLEIDKTRQILRSSGSEMTVTIENLNNIRDYVRKLRTEMVTP
jgi:hypothetical protein